MTMLPMHIAAAQGFDQEEGFTRDLRTGAGRHRGARAPGGEVDFSMSAGALLAAAVQGVPIRIVVVHVAKSLFWLYSRPDVTQLDQFPGRSPSTLWAARRMSRRGSGCSARGSIRAACTSSRWAARRFPARSSPGAVDAAVIAPPQDIQLAREGQFTNHGFLGDELPSLSSGLGATETLIAQKPEMVRAAVRAALKGQRFLQANRAAALPIMADYLY